MPGATWLPLPEADDQGSYTKTQLIYHSTGSAAGARANRNYFAQSKVQVESTFIVDYDGEVVQVMEASARADANGSANRRAISVEMVGTGDEPFTPAQVESAIAIARWACDEHQISRRRIPSESESGIGWHVMFGAPGPWTSVAGKVCPGTKRIQQIRDVIIPAATQSAALRLPPAPADIPRGPSMVIVKNPSGNDQHLVHMGRRWYIASTSELAAYAAACPRVTLDQPAFDRLEEMA